VIVSQPSTPRVEHDAPIPTWFGVGGRADALARPRAVDEVRELLRAHAGGPVRALGEGANLIVDDEGVDGLVLDLRGLSGVEWLERPGESTVLVRAQSGADLPRLITESARRGLTGIETLAGIPATIGGAIVMNAGGAFGQISDVVEGVQALTRAGEIVTIPRSKIDFGYRHSGLNDLIILGADLRLRRVPESERAALRDRLKEVMAYKKGSQPMAERSAGCFFKNPTDPKTGQRVSAGMLIDRAGGKGLRIGGATVSDRHANFIVTGPGCTARDVLTLADQVVQRVREHSGIQLEREVVVWRRAQ